MLNGRYETVSPLNHGSFGMVFMARDCHSGSLVAVKCLTKSSAAKDADSSFMVDDRSEELAIHTRIGAHPNIVNLLDSFETENHNYLVLEYCSQGDLYEAIRQDKGPKQTDHIRDFMLQLVNAVEYLHNRSIFHRDIKPENIFLTDDGKMKLGDFGLATMDLWSYEASVGSDRYMAPEQYDPAGNGLSPARADIWSIGICLLNILFSRNPFAVPATSDPLFADFAKDRQSLFDVFPNMSQDAFEVLRHCLVVDPAKRSLEMVKETLKGVVSFTCDDDTSDDFCTDQRNVLTATANREPLRTPSITSPVAENGEFFQWAKHLHAVPAVKARQLSVIHDDETEDLFPGSEADARDWYSKAETQSINSIVDSGLGVSITSGPPLAAYINDRSRPVAIGSVPTFGSRARGLASLFSKKREFESKSWSDMWDEEEEERLQSERDVELSKTMPIGKSRLSQLSQADTEDDGRSTPRGYLVELHNPGNAPRTSTDSRLSLDDSNEHVSEHTGFIFDDDRTPTQSMARYSPPKRTSLKDKWSALGDRRRGTFDSTSRELVSPDTKKRIIRAKEWRRNIGEKVVGLSRTYAGGDTQKLDHGVWQQKEWSVSKDWRRSNQDLNKPNPLRPDMSQLDGSADVSDFDDNESAIVDDDDWYGGWKDLHV